MHLQWRLKKFDALTPLELYDILRLRNEVFVVEQQCVFQDADNLDQPSHHLMGFRDAQLVAYTRIIPAGVAYPMASIGRVVTAPSVRRTGAGKLLMQESIDKLFQLYGPVPIKIGAQLYLKSFYEGFGFRRVGDVYLEDGIEHISMERPVS
ncbi:MAG TPA: GNAT family N-acetyltransferase [Flavisolibacter sp.]